MGDDTRAIVLTDAQQAFLDAYLHSVPDARRSAYHSFSADYFCADEENANLCAKLVRDGVKTATCSLKYWYASGLEPMPAVGHLQVVTDWHGRPHAVIETLEVTECLYNEVTEEFARAEGEGDRSLRWWRQAHWAFFSRECEEEGIELSETMQLVLERFRVVYP